MKNYLISLKTSPIKENNWESHYDFIDQIRGASLVENPNCPEILFDINSTSWEKAKTSPLNMAKSLKLTVISIELLEEVVI